MNTRDQVEIKKRLNHDDWDASLKLELLWLWEKDSNLHEELSLRTKEIFVVNPYPVFIALSPPPRQEGMATFSSPHSINCYVLTFKDKSKIVLFYILVKNFQSLREYFEYNL